MTLEAELNFEPEKTAPSRLATLSPEPAGGQRGAAPFGKGRAQTLVGRQSHESKPPRHVGLDAGARGMAKHLTPESDSLLVWYRSHGESQKKAVGLYLARRIVAAGWTCSTQDALILIDCAMTRVAAGRTRKRYLLPAMRRDDAQELMALATAWLRAGIMDAEWRYGLANAELETPASRQT